MSHNFKHLKDSLESLFTEDEKLKDHYHQTHLMSMWTTIVGPMVGKYTSNIRIKDKTIFVYIASAPLKQELLFSKTELLKKINAALTYLKLEELVIQ